MINQGELNELALFAGAGGGILGGHLLGWRTVCAVEWEPYPASVLCARQNDGLLPPFPIWDDVQTFDGHPWRGVVDVISGGFPCQDISVAGKGAGIDGERSGMWGHMARVVGEVRPRYVFVENSPMLVTRGLERVLSDLTALGYDTKWTVMGAAHIGANHQRDRIWIKATAQFADPNLQPSSAQPQIKHHRPQESYASSKRGMGAFDATETVAFSKSSGLERWSNGRHSKQGQSRLGQIGWSIERNWSFEPNLGRVANGVAARVDRLKAIGNGQVPLCAATAWRLLGVT